ncbi:hypothetical protein PAL_GLEAN10016394 [Pteropus alecto]|uniref:Uncharacterized protein n=1 Tax=Pteropus alecto TaxID=9402 RepID=L5JPA1_PTEAL|nr:hypothetical protein PAL_GLEAN10016394 [Pteropus alecto]
MADFLQEALGSLASKEMTTPSDSEPSVHSEIAIVVSGFSNRSKSSQPCKLHFHSQQVTVL